MKKIFTFITLIVVLLTSCSISENKESKIIYPQFTIEKSYSRVVPDSLREKYQEFINTTIKNTVNNKNILAKDLDDLVDEINDIAFDLYSSEYYYLKIKNSEKDEDYIYIEQDDLNNDLKIIYDSVFKSMYTVKPQNIKNNTTDIEKGKSIGRNAVLMYLSKNNYIKDSIKLDIDKLLAIEDSLASNQIYK